ncbi:hypothetical protein ACROYT_G009012 [Oculina patagonica]
MKSVRAENNLQIKELQDQLTLYRNQVTELREEVDKKAKQLQEMNNEIRQLREKKESLSTHLKSALTVVDSEELVRSIAKEQFSDLEKGKAMIEQEGRKRRTDQSA